MTKRVKNMLVALLMVVMVIPCFSMGVSAEEDDTVSAAYEDISTIAISCSRSGTTLTYVLAVDGSTDVVKIDAALQLQQYSGGAYVNYGSKWTVTDTPNVLITSGTKTVASGYTYRLRAVIVAYTSDGGASSVIVYS